MGEQSQPREARGTATGGQFAAQARPDADVALSPTRGEPVRPSPVVPGEPCPGSGMLAQVFYYRGDRVSEYRRIDRDTATGIYKCFRCFGQFPVTKRWGGPHHAPTSWRISAHLAADPRARTSSTTPAA